jgi:hypothetical protein
MNFRTQIIVAAVLGQVLGPLGYVEPLFIPLILAGPPVVGAVAATRGIRLAPVAVLWVSAGLNMAWMDWVIAREDVVFHLALAVVMALLAAAGYGVVRLFSRRSTPAGA